MWVHHVSEACHERGCCHDYCRLFLLNDYYLALLWGSVPCNTSSSLTFWPQGRQEDADLDEKREEEEEENNPSADPNRADDTLKRQERLRGENVGREEGEGRRGEESMPINVEKRETTIQQQQCTV